MQYNSGNYFCFHGSCFLKENPKYVKSDYLTFMITIAIVIQLYKLYNLQISLFIFRCSIHPRDQNFHPEPRICHPERSRRIDRRIDLFRVATEG